MLNRLNRLGLGSRQMGGGEAPAIFTITGTGATESTLSLFFPTSENGKTITATGAVKFGAAGNETTHIITGNATNSIKVWCPNAETGTILLPNTYTRFSANTSDVGAANGWATQAGSPSISLNIASLPSVLITFYCSGSNTVSGDLPSDWMEMKYFYCSGSNTVSGDLPSDWMEMKYFYCYGSNTVSGDLPSDWKEMTYFVCSGGNTVSGALPSDWKAMTYFLCDGPNTVSGIASGVDASTSTSMSRIYLDPITGSGLSILEQSRILVLMSTKTTWGSPRSIGFYAPCASMADTAADGIWDYTTVPTPALAAAIKTLVITKGVTITLRDVNFTTGGGLPSGFVTWLNS